MELENLRKVWNKEPVKQKKQSGSSDIQALLVNHSRSPIAIMKRNLFKELVAVVILYGTAIAYFASQEGYRGISIMLGALSVNYLFYYFRKRKILENMEIMTGDVCNNLQKQVVMLGKYMRFYFFAGTLLTPVAFLSGLLILFYGPGHHLLPPLSKGFNFYLLFTLLGLVITVGTFLINKWYVNKLYGQHISKVKGLLEELEERIQLTK